MQISLSAEQIVKTTRPTDRRGNTDREIEGISALAEAREGELSFLQEKKYLQDLAESRASIILVPDGCPAEPAENQLFLYFENPSAALSRLCSHIERRLRPRPVPGVHPTAVIGANCRLPDSVTVGPHCVIADNVSLGENTVLDARVYLGQGTVLGDDCRLLPGVVVMDGCRLGHRITLHPGVVVGADGFGYVSDVSGHAKIPQVGGVLIEDDVEIGAGSTVDRARFSMTVIGEGTKIDNLVQVGHNVRIGRHCILCALVGIAGSTVLGDFVVLGGQVGVAGHLKIGSGAKVGAQSGIGRSVEPNSSHFGTPAVPLLLRQKIILLQKRLPDLFRRVDRIEAELEKAFDKGKATE